MKKKFISAMAISLCLCMGAMVGCGDNKNNSSSSSSPKEPLTKDEILAEIGDAYAATKAYKGGYTVTGTSKSEYKDFTDEEAEVYNGTLELTADTNQKLVYYKEAGEEGYELQKLLKNGTDYIMYSEDKSGEEDAEEDYEKVTEAYAAYYINEYYSYENIIDRYISAEMFEIESIDAYNSAYAKVIADSVAEINAGTADETSEFYGCKDPACTVSFTAVETEDGAYVFTQTMNMQLTTPDYESEEEEKAVTASTISKTVVTAKDGKLTGMQEIEETTRTKQISDTETQTYVYKDETTYTVSYTFDQAKYDSVSVTLPETVESRNYYSKDVTVLVNGMEFDTYTGFRGSTIQGAVNYLVSNVKNQLNASEENATVTLYTDAGYTKALDGATLTEAELYAIETVYAKVELKEGYALLNQMMSNAFGADVTAEQKTVFAMMMGAGWQRGLHVTPVANPYPVGSQATQMDATKVLVNGVAYTEAELTMESGETYTVEYVSEVSKADLNIFMIF